MGTAVEQEEEVIAEQQQRDNNNKKDSMREGFWTGDGEGDKEYLLLFLRLRRWR
jgi:hypothetical protein